jgi:hypothetical protein
MKVSSERWYYSWRDNAQNLPICTAVVILVHTLLCLIECCSSLILQKDKVPSDLSGHITKQQRKSGSGTWIIDWFFILTTPNYSIKEITVFSGVRTRKMGPQPLLSLQIFPNTVWLILIYVWVISVTWGKKYILRLSQGYWAAWPPGHVLLSYREEEEHVFAAGSLPLLSLAALHAPPSPPCCPLPISIPKSKLWGTSAFSKNQTEPWKS